MLKYFIRAQFKYCFREENIKNAKELMVLKKKKDASVTYWGGAMGIPYVLLVLIENVLTRKMTNCRPFKNTNQAHVTLSVAIKMRKEKLLV